MSLAVSPFAPDRFPDLPAVGGVRAAVMSRGFYAHRGLTRDDLFLCVFDPGTIAAGVFTRSQTASADVRWCRQALASGAGAARALIVHAGNSNAFTGSAGEAKNAATLDALARTLDIPRNSAFLAATGVIGEPLADPNHIGAVVPQLARALGPVDWARCARAFMTTDTYPKGASAVCDIDGRKVRFAGIAKGSGMIAPNMATMLAYVFTDAAIAAPILDRMLRQVTDRTFNAITVDGDTSTSDTLMVFATRASGMPEVTDPQDPRLAPLAEALQSVCEALACQIVKDGEGATRFITVTVEDAATDADARAVAGAVANSPLVKTALAAGDANWGRVVMAIGKALVPVDPDALRIWFGDHLVAENGARARTYDEAEASRICAAAEISIRIALGAGAGRATMWTCDLTHAYVDINGAYRT